MRTVKLTPQIHHAGWHGYERVLTDAPVAFPGKTRPIPSLPVSDTLLPPEIQRNTCRRLKTGIESHQLSEDWPP